MKDLELPYLAVIPHTVLADADLQPNAKLFYGCLVGLAKKEGFCWASNEQLANMFGVKERIVSQWLSALENKGFISREIENTPHKENKHFFWKTERKIFVNDAFSKKSYEHAQKCNPEHAQKCNPVGDAQKCNPIKEYNKSLSEKEENIYKRKFEPYVEFSEQEYETWKAKLGEPLLLEMIQAINDHCVNNRPKGYRDYSGAMRSFLANRKVPACQSPPLIANNEYIKKLMEKNPELVKKRTLQGFGEYFEISNKGATWSIRYGDNGFIERVKNQLLKWDIDYDK